MKRYQADMTLREQARDLRRVDLAEKQRIVQIARAFLGLESREFGATAHEKEADVLAMSQTLHQLDEDVHALGDAHIADVSKDLAAGERGIRDRDAASDVGGH